MKPLASARVLDLSRFAPGPFATLILASLGAEVIKVETPRGGDPMRALDPSAFERLNRGKKSVALDLETEEGRSRLLELAGTADVLVDGFRPRARERLGLESEAFFERASRLVHVSILGYDEGGPNRERAGHDINYLAVTGALRGAVAPSPLQVADFAAGGLYAAMGILAGLRERDRTGKGVRIELSMEGGLRSMMLLADGEIGDRLSGRYPNYAVYETRDGGTLSVGALEPKFWRAFCEGIGRLDLVDRVSDPEARREVAAAVRERSLADWESVFAERDACVEAVRSPGPPPPPSRVLPFGGQIEEASLGRAPALGEHNEELFG